MKKPINVNTVQFEARQYPLTLSDVVEGNVVGVKDQPFLCAIKEIQLGPNGVDLHLTRLSDGRTVVASERQCYKAAEVSAL